MALFRCASGSGGGGGSAPELIWENPNKTTSFSAQTVNESSTGWVSGKHYADYDGFIIAACNHATSALLLSLNYITDVSSLTDISSMYKPYLMHPESAIYRAVELLSNGISIKSCASGDTYIIPYYIWGVKGELSE